MKDLLDYILKGLVNNPEAVEITEEDTQDGINFKIKVDPADTGMVIGKSGATIKAIRKLLITRSMAEGQNIRVNLTLSEE